MSYLAHRRIPRIPRRSALATVLAAAVLTAAQPGTASAPGAQSGALPANPPVAGQEGGTGQGEKKSILDMDIEQLGKVDVVTRLPPALSQEVTTVTRSESTVGRSPAAVFVITSEMIRRSGATNLPEVLRMVPGLEVARINASQWAVSARGFNSRYANKLLVQVDGRSIYNPLFGGVFWEDSTVMLEDIERIEVVRGPGATVWGANAVNGVINIITKKAADTQGLLVHGIAGSEVRGYTAARYGGQVGRDLQWRVYGLQFDCDQGTLPDGNAADDGRSGQAGFRADWQPTGSDAVTVQGDYHDSRDGVDYPVFMSFPPYSEQIVEDSRHSGGNALVCWSREIDEDRNWSARLYYDRFRRQISAVDESYDTIDLDFQDQFPLGDGHRLVWGSGYRYYRVRSQGTYQVSFDPPGRDLDLFSYFVEDEITLAPDRWFLTAGSKFEHSDFTSFEFQPSARLLWSPDERRAVWAAISRAVRLPSVADEDLRNITRAIFVGPPPPIFVQFEGRRSVEAEDLLAYELGYRAQPSDKFSWDLALFFNKYEDLVAFVPTPLSLPPPPIWVWPAENAMDGEGYGGELTGTWQVTPSWQVTGSYSYLQLVLHATGGADPRIEAPETAAPHSQVYVRSSWDLSDDLEFDTILRYVDSIQVTGRNVPRYVTMDLRLAWRPSKNLEVAGVVQNLLDDHHLEFQGADSAATEVDRGAYGSVTWRY